MNQIKYPLYACLLILVCLLVFNFFYKLSSSSIVYNETTVYQSKSESDYSKPNVVTGPYLQGYKTFKENCATCHALDKVITGPALRSVEERGPWTERKNLIKWVHDPAAFIPTSPYTNDLQQQYGQIMPSFPQISEKDIQAIFDYIKYSQPSFEQHQAMPAVASL